MEKEVQTTVNSDNETEKKEVKTLETQEKCKIKFLVSSKKLYVQCLEEAFPYPSYENSYDPNSLIKINKYFQIFGNINEVCSIIKSINENTIKIDKKKNLLLLQLNVTIMKN